MTKHLQYKMKDGSVVEYFLNKKNIKNMWIKLNKKNQIVLSVPNLIDEKIALTFLEKHIDKFVNVQKQKTKNKWIDVEKKCFNHFGQIIFFELDVENKWIYFLDTKIKNKKTGIESSIDHWRKNELKKFITTKQPFYEKLMEIEPHLINVRAKANAWATNHVTSKKIYYSVNLSTKDLDLIEYVIVHELAHNKHRNHSVDFWKLVEKFVPDYKFKKRKLNS